MLTLAIETSGEINGIALVKEGSILELRQRKHRMDLLQRLAADISDILADHSICIRDLDLIAVSLGPGSFTGLRVGVVTAKSMAWSAGKSLVGIPTLDIIAAEAIGHPLAKSIVAAIPARKGEVFYSVYKSSDGKLQRTSEYGLASLNPIGIVSKSPIIVCGPASKEVMEGFRAAGTEAYILGMEQKAPNPGTLAALAEERAKNGEINDPIALVPLYIRKPTPEIRLEERSL